MASGDTLINFTAQEYQPPASNYAQYGFRNGHPHLAFDQTVQEATFFGNIMPRHYSGNGVDLVLHWIAASGVVTNKVAWDIAFERMSDGTTDLTADSFATAVSVAGVTVPGTSGIEGQSSVNIPSANMDGIVAGDTFRMRVRRDPTVSPNAAGDIQLIAVEMRDH